MDTYELRSELEAIKLQLKNADIPEKLFNNKELVNLAMKLVMIKELRKMNENIRDLKSHISRNRLGM
jgi:hypothetical protein